MSLSDGRGTKPAFLAGVKFKTETMTIGPSMYYHQDDIYYHLISLGCDELAMMYQIHCEKKRQEEFWMNYFSPKIQYSDQTVTFTLTA